jgi:hypothetical protein
MTLARAAGLAAALLLSACGGQRVRVTDASSGAPLPGARVAIDGGDAPPVVLLTDASGVARFQRSPPFRVDISAEGFSGSSLSAPGGRGSSYDVALAPSWLATFLANQEREIHDAANRKQPCHCPGDAR